MRVVTPHDVPIPWEDEQRLRIDELIDEYRSAMHDCLDGLTEEEARLRLVPSSTTLLGLVKHVTFVEGVWFDQAVTGRGYGEIGIATTPAGSFALRASDTIPGVQAEYRRRCERSRATMAALSPSDVVDGRGTRAVWALHLQVLRELAQHAGHADILREQILAHRTSETGETERR
ncbi:DinB family protein [Desertimonas flava]|uniref:DinB family protein n=1 Tax=Desertimonas flava TaxID=2064846 RepID=UPI000E348013